MDQQNNQGIPQDRAGKTGQQDTNRNVGRDDKRRDRQGDDEIVLEPTENQNKVNDKTDEDTDGNTGGRGAQGGGGRNPGGGNNPSRNP